MTDSNAPIDTEIGTRVVNFPVTAEYAGQRIDNFLLRELKGVPKSRVYRLLRKGEVRVNRSRIRAEYRLAEGDVVRIPPVRLAQRSKDIQPSANLQALLEGAVLYEDEQLLVVNKPSGLAVHGGSGIKQGLIEALRKLRPEARFLELVHRLDRDTSGCVMIAKRRSMLRYLHEQLRTGNIDKYYWALVVGRWPNRRRAVNAPLQKNVLQSGERMVHVAEEGKASLTEFSVLERYQDCTLVEAKPITGRTHQIRVHAKHAGHPLLGDDKYGVVEVDRQFKQKGLNRLFLHASRLQLELPEGRAKLDIKAPLPADLETLLKHLVKA